MEQLEYKYLSYKDINEIGNGINNCGNSCFFNATNQMLFHIPELREFLIQNKNIFENNIILNLIELFNKMKTKTVVSDDILHDKTLRDFYKDVQQKLFIDLDISNLEDKSYTAQRDASELFRRYLDIINIDIFSNLMIPKKPDIEINLLSNLIPILPNISLYHKYNEFKICIDNKDKVTNKFIYNISLQIDPTNEEFNINIDDYVAPLSEVRPWTDRTTGITKIDYDNYKKCDREPNSINTESHYHTYPNKYLFINLNRFATGEKLDYPINNINLDEEFIMKDRNSNSYKLIGSICHSGVFDGGHYTYIHSGENNKWKYYDDESVEDGHIGITTENMYILIFRNISKIYIYDIPYNIKYINNTILQNLDDYLKDNKILGNFSDIELNSNFCINILVYYVSLYNQKSHPQYKEKYNSYLLSIRNKLIKNIKNLLI